RRRRSGRAVGRRVGPVVRGRVAVVAVARGGAAGRRRVGDDRARGFDPRRPLDEQPDGRARAPRPPGPIRPSPPPAPPHPPLPGGAPGAENRMLMFMIGGDDDAVARVMPVVEPLGRAAFHLGPLGQGNTMKLVNSLLAYAATWASLEGLSLCVKAGIPVQRA